jgi:hypothetical protein
LGISKVKALSTAVPVKVVVPSVAVITEPVETETTALILCRLKQFSNHHHLYLKLAIIISIS